MLFRSIATRGENCSVRLQKGIALLSKPERSTLLQSFRRALIANSKFSKSNESPDC
jgi:hypothetical protein